MVQCGSSVISYGIVIPAKSTGKEANVGILRSGEKKKQHDKEQIFRTICIMVFMIS